MFWTAASERSARLIAAALRALGFEAAFDTRAPRIEVRHPQVRPHGVPWLVAIITMEPNAVITYAVPHYRVAIEHVIAKAEARLAR